MARSIDFFDQQFQRQVLDGPATLNPFEALALPFLAGDVLDLGCGLGLLALAAARRGCRILALDGSATGIEYLRAQAAAEGLPVDARVVELRGDTALGGPFDAVVSIGLLMFLAPRDAWALLVRMQEVTRPGGTLILNVLVRGTTWRDALDPSAHLLFAPAELRAAFDGWTLVGWHEHVFPAPAGSEKHFVTIVARRV